MTIATSGNAIAIYFFSSVLKHKAKATNLKTPIGNPTALLL
jgi:hypothetical protein